MQEDGLKKLKSKWKRRKIYKGKKLKCAETSPGHINCFHSRRRKEEYLPPTRR